VTDFEQRANIEVLKLRFGDAALQVCDVMLKDMTDSRRLDAHFRSQNAVRLDVLGLRPGRLTGLPGSTRSDGYLGTFLACHSALQVTPTWAIGEVILSGSFGLVTHHIG
jgi:hypothetical protein